MHLRAKDLLVILKLVSPQAPREYVPLARELSMSPSEVHASVKRAIAAGLLGPDKVVNKAGLLDFLVHGVRYAFAPERGRVTRGMPTAHGVPPLSQLVEAGGEAAPVWPDPQGTARGEALTPLYRSVPAAARKDAQLHVLLALVDAVRGGRARERALAAEHLRRLITP